MHPSLPLVLSSSDDMLIKLWDWDKVRSCRLLPSLLMSMVCHVRPQALTGGLCCRTGPAHRSLRGTRTTSCRSECVIV